MPTARYSLAWLLDARARGASFKYLPFWGPEPKAGGQLGASCLSQWWAGHPFIVAGITYPTAEYWMMAGKARYFGDQATLEAILAASSAGAAKALGRQVQPFDHAAWEGVRVSIVRTGNGYKFGQHPELAAFLRQTGDRVLVEASPVDRIWGGAGSG